MICPSVRTLILATLVISSFGLANAGTPPAVEPDGVPKRHNEATVAQLQAEMASGKLTSEALTKEYIARIVALDQNGPGVNSVIELNPDALAMARNADVLRRHAIGGLADLSQLAMEFEFRGGVDISEIAIGTDFH